MVQACKRKTPPLRASAHFVPFFFGYSSCFSLHVMTNHYTLSSIPYLFCVAFSPLFCVLLFF